MKKIYIAGSGGMLGAAFFDVFKEDYLLKCTDIDLNVDWLHRLDFRNYLEYKRDVDDFSPDYLFHLGAHTSLEYCEENKDDCYLTNTIAVEHAVRIANELQIPLLYISTAGIFDGEKDVYDDWDSPNPLGAYARSKYLGEKYVVENCNRYLICRAGWMMGGGIEKDKKFIGKLYRQLLSGKKNLHIVNDRFGTPTYTVDFARNVRILVENNIFGLFNMVCNGLTSRVEVARAFLDVMGKKTEIEIIEVDSTFFNSEYFAPRPHSERLISYRLQIQNLYRMRNWQICLEEYVEKNFLKI